LERYDIWVVEDGDAFRKQLVALLNKTEEFSCSRDFRSCEQLLDALADEAPPEIVLMDIALPGISGTEGIRRLKDVAPAVRSVVLTIQEDDDTVVEAIAAGAAGYLHKSSTLTEIVQSLKTILTGGAPMNPAIARKMLTLFKALSPTREQGESYGLTKRELELLQFLTGDLTQKEIADRMFVSTHTVNMHLRNIYGKLNVRSRGAAVAKVLRERLV
jgi:DNA-binding NarL/FixJ family response regulator